MSTDMIISRSVEETRAAARLFCRSLAPGAVVRLDGDLGAGKTEFVKGMAEELRVLDEVTSPTFPIVQEYACADGSTLVHVDFYRIDNASDLVRLGLEEMFDRARCSVVEWGGKFPALLGLDAVGVEIAARPSGERQIVFLRRETCG